MRPWKRPTSRWISYWKMLQKRVPTTRESGMNFLRVKMVTLRTRSKKWQRLMHLVQLRRMGTQETHLLATAANYITEGNAQLSATIAKTWGIWPEIVGLGPWPLLKPHHPTTVERKSPVMVVVRKVTTVMSARSLRIKGMVVVTK